MLTDLFTDKTGSALSRALDGYAVRQKAIANNIANVETPGFHRSEVVFETDLRTALEASGRSVQKQLADVSPTVQADTESPERPDGNNVNIDKEMADLAKNGLSYRAATTLLELKGSILKYVINGR